MGMDSGELNMLHLGGRFDEADVRPQDAWVDAIRRVSLDEARDWTEKMLAEPALWTFSGPASALAGLPRELQP